MRAKLHPRLKLARIRHPWATDADDQNGAFELVGPNKRRLIIIASSGEGWDHVSVSVRGTDDPPTWEEMCFVKSLMFDDDEVCMQLHPAASNYINHHTGCLHLWKPQDEKIPLPPLILV
jgi:hypothetical protein